MKFSIKVQYGLQAILELALNLSGEPLQIGIIAKSQKIPIRFLEQLLLILKRSGLVSSARGKSGGYLLAKRPSEISLQNMIEILDGPIEFTNKKLNKQPILFEAFVQIQESLKKELSEVTIEDLILKKRQEDRNYTYNI